MVVTITKIEKPFWKAGILRDNFSGKGFTGDCNACIYRNRMTRTTVCIKGVGRRGFALASMPLDWTPKIGDTVTIHESQL